MTVYDISVLVGDAFCKSMTSGFRAAGIVPLNQNIFEEHKFIPAMTTDRPHPREISHVGCNIYLGWLFFFFSDDAIFCFDYGASIPEQVQWHISFHTKI